MFFGVMSSLVAYRVANVDVGYETRNLLSASIGLSGDAYDTREKRGAFFQSVADGLNRRSALDGALLRSSIAGISDRAGAFSNASVGGVPSTAGPRAYVEGVLGSLSVLGISLNSGRFFDARDDESQQRRGDREPLDGGEVLAGPTRGRRAHSTCGG
jgi:hypothetical protein